MNAQQYTEPVHEIIVSGPLAGQQRHTFEKVDGDWTCECGERRDRFGKPLPDLLSLVIPE